MTRELKSLLGYIDEILKPQSFADVCVNGLQVEGKKSIKHIATSVSATLESIQRAKKVSADLLLVHHGLFLKGKDIVIHESLKAKLQLLFTANMGLLAYHIPLDAHRELGNNWAAAKLLGFSDLEPFGEYFGMRIAVQGRCKPMPRKKFCKMLETFYGRRADVVNGGPADISSFALCSGAGHKLIYEAKQAGVDCLITGTVDEPVWHMAKEEKINFFALGHAATEKIGVQLLGEHLAEEFSLRHTFIDDDNPF